MERKGSSVDKLHLAPGLTGFVKKNIVMVVAMIAALVTCFLVPPDAAYLGYFDVKTLTCLFCVLAVVCALKNINFFYILAKKIVLVFKKCQNEHSGSGIYYVPGLHAHCQ